MSGQKDFHIRIPYEVYKKLQVASDEKGIAIRWLIVSAIENFVSGDGQSGTDELKKPIYELNRRLKGLRGDVEILGELLSFFIYHWLGYTPRLDKTERASLAIEARERHKRFMQMFIKKLTAGEMSFAPALTKGVYGKEEGDNEDS